jgi:hypothetical protein
MRATVVAFLICGTVLASTDDTAVNAFQERLEAYVKLRKEATDKVPALKKKAQPEEIQQRELALAEAIRKARPAAKAGDILASDIVPTLRSILKGAFTGERRKDLKASVKEGNPKHEKAAGEVVPVIQVNAIYPKNAPLSTVPPTLLARLPKLPKDLEYRFVGRTLVLRDSESSLIVDYLKEAVPAL